MIEYVKSTKSYTRPSQCLNFLSNIIIVGSMILILCTQSWNSNFSQFGRQIICGVVMAVELEQLRQNIDFRKRG